MAELHEALKSFSGVEWDQVPQDHDSLAQYMTDCFAAGELVCNSVPPLPNGTPFSDSTPHHRVPNSAKSHTDIHPSAARPHPPHSDHEGLQKNWGKPVKLKPADNPLQVSLYKMAGNDRHGAWFARRSIHEGLGFDKWKRAMMREFPESMAVTGGPGAGAVRGIAADRRLEEIVVDGVGKLEVYELSAQFPGPVTPRDFLAAVLTSDNALSEKSAAQLPGGKAYVPRHFMVVSRPIEHPEAPLRSGFVRGHYESVEMIREIPLCHTKSKPIDTESDPQAQEGGITDGAASGDSDDTVDDPELNPVEWTMITRSDPGGGIPRFLVERGTPDAMIADVHKFFGWACGKDHHSDPKEGIEKQLENSEEQVNDKQDPGRKKATVDSTFPGIEQQNLAGAVSTSSSSSQGGIMTNLAKAVEAGIDSYAPTTVSNMVLQRENTARGEDLTDDSSDTSSIDSFISAEELREVSPTPDISEGRPVDSVESLGMSEVSKDPKPLGHHEKEVLKLAKKREKLEQQLAKRRAAEETKFKQSQEKDESDANKYKDEMEKRLKKTEEKHRREMQKLETKKAKEERKAEEKRRKKDEQNKISLVTRERDDFRSQSDLYRRENTLLRGQVADLQAQNNMMAEKLLEFGGQDVLNSVQSEGSHNRSKSSLKSVGSSGSSDSVAKSYQNKSENTVADAS